MEHFWIHLIESLNLDEMCATPKLPEVLRRVFGPSFTLQQRVHPTRTSVKTKKTQSLGTENIEHFDLMQYNNNNPYGAASQPLDGDGLRFRSVNFRYLRE